MNRSMSGNFRTGSDRTAIAANDLVPPDRSNGSAGWVIAATSFAFAVIQLDVTIVNVALPRISEELGASLAQLQWVVDAYTLGFAALLLSAGVVVDRLGAKRVFSAGFVGFALTSLACGLAPGSGFLNFTRSIQGIGAALLVPSSLTVLNEACAHDWRLRARAIGIWTAAGGVAIAAGPVVGGLLVSWLGWRSIFFVNVPICAFGLILTLRCVPPSQVAKEEHRSFDLPGQALAIVALTALIGAVIEARPLGISHPVVMAGCLLALAGTIGFIAVEARTASPMLPLQFFRLPGFTPAVAFGVLVNCAYYGIIFVLSLYLQKTMGYSTVQAGLAFLPLTGTFIASNMASGWMVGKTGSRAPMVLGAVIGAVGYLLLIRLDAQATFIQMLPAFLLIPAGMGLAVPAMTTSILSSVDRARSGTASAVLNAARQVGGAIGVAAFGTLASGVARSQIISGLRTAAFSAAGLLAVAAIAALAVHPGSKPDKTS